MYRYRQPKIYFIHKCSWCKKRLETSDVPVALENFLGDGIEIERWFCSKACARKYHLTRLRESEETTKLNEEIKVDK